MMQKCVYCCCCCYCCLCHNLTAKRIATAFGFSFSLSFYFSLSVSLSLFCFLPTKCARRKAATQRIQKSKLLISRSRATKQAPAAREKERGRERLFSALAISILQLNVLWKFRHDATSRRRRRRQQYDRRHYERDYILL